jgi:hypothetical protein
LVYCEGVRVRKGVARCKLLGERRGRGRRRRRVNCGFVVEEL